MNLPYIPLRVHTAFSTGSLVPSDFAGLKEKCNVTALGLSDLASLHVWGRARREARKYGLKLIYGAEVEIRGGKLVILVREGSGMRTLLRAINRGEIGKDGVIRIFVPSGRVELQEVPLKDREGLYIGIEAGNRRGAWELARKNRLPLVLAQPVEYSGSLERYFLTRSLRSGIPYPELRKKAGGLNYNRILSAAELLELFGALSGEITGRTFEVAEMCDFDPVRSVPSLPDALYFRSLRRLVFELTRRKYGSSIPPRVRERLFRELKAIEETGFAAYFLLVKDIVDYAKRMGILHNLRGSGASSFVAYILGISHVNPLEHDLYFERFLNSGRKEPPDIDVDLEAGGREKVLEYIFGPEFPLRGKIEMAMVSTFRFYRARSALYDTMRALGFSPREAAELRARVPYGVDPMSLLKIEAPRGFRKVFRLAASLSMIPKDVSLHVGGVLFVPTPLEDYLPVSSSTKGFPQCHFDSEAVEDFGLVKLDLLSVRGLKLISECMRATGVRNFPENDEKVYRALSRGDTLGCFQIESPGMMALLRRMRPRNLRELSFALALIRPGPTETGMKELYLAIREGRRKPEPLFLKLLPETSGLLLFEEQVMQVVVRTLGVSIEEAEHLRQKLKKGGSPGLLQYFMERALKQGFTRSDAEKIYSLLTRFSSYSFNRAHSVSYAWMAEKAIYFKVHYPHIFFSALLRSDGGYYRLPAYVQEARRKGFEILPPSVISSELDFVIEGEFIRAGLGRIKHLRAAAVRKILRERKERPFSSMADFLLRVKLNFREKLSLIDSGAFDSLEPDRRMQLLGLLGGRRLEQDIPPPDPREEKLRMFEALGFLPRGHPLELLSLRLPLRVEELSRLVNREVEIDLYLLDLRLKRVKRGKLLFFLLEDETGIIQGMASDDLSRKVRSEFLRVRARVRAYREGLRLEIFDLESLFPSGCGVFTAEAGQSVL